MIVTNVLTCTAAVVIVTVAVKPFAGTVADGGTLATDGLLLENAISAPPSGAPVLKTTVLVDEFPPTTEEGLVSMVDRVAGGGAVSGVKLRTVDHGPATPLTFTPRTRQKCVTVASPVVAYMVEPLTVALRTSGAVNPLESSI